MTQSTQLKGKVVAVRGAVVDVANAKACDLIVMASHGRRGISAIVLGSETVKVLTHSTIPVLVYRGARAGLSSPYFAAS